MSSSEKGRLTGNLGRKIDEDSHEGPPVNKTCVEGQSVEDSIDISTRRLQIEYQRLTENPPDDIRVRLKEDNLFKWEAAIKGPPGTAYEGGTFLLDLYTENFPFTKNYF